MSDLLSTRIRGAWLFGSSLCVIAACGGQGSNDEAGLLANGDPESTVLKAPVTDGGQTVTCHDGSASGQAVTGWLSPAKSQSANTPSLLVEHGVEYMCDWINDDLPFPFRTAAGDLTAMPLSTELEDRFVIMDNGHAELEWAEQVEDACDFLINEAETMGGGRLLALNIHPWMLGQPHRIRALERVLQHITDTGKVWSAAPGEIFAAWRAAQS